MKMKKGKIADPGPAVVVKKASTPPPRKVTQRKDKAKLVSEMTLEEKMAFAKEKNLPMHMRQDLTNEILLEILKALRKR